MSKTKRIKNFYNLLYNHYGHQNWWPGESRLECIIGTILTQNTSWKNVEKAIYNLKSEINLTVEDLTKIPLERLSTLIRPSGYFNQKAKRIKNIINFINDKYSGNIENMLKVETLQLRERLLEINGIGPETADSILLYVFKKPIFVIDTYTYRILARHGLIPEDSSYNEMQDLFMTCLENDATLFNEYHALIVIVGKEHCKKNAVCEGCPLESDPHEV